MNLDTNKDGSVEIRDLDHPMHFIPISGHDLKVRMYDGKHPFFILDYGDVQYKFAKGNVPEMLIGENRIDENE